MVRLSLVALVTLATIGTAAAASCPASVSGRSLRSSGGGMLFQGPIGRGVDLAPDSSAGTQRQYVNLWHLRDGAGVTLVCYYDGISGGVPFALDPGPTTCRQDPRSFVCSR